MSTYAEIDHAVEVLGKHDLVLMHATSTYPAKYEQLNLRAIPDMIERYGVPVGYSGHETGIPTRPWPRRCWAPAAWSGTSRWTAPCGAPTRRRPWSRTASRRLVRDIRLCEQSMGDGIKRVYEEEIPVMKKLRRVGAAV